MIAVPTQKVHSPTPSPEKISVLLVSPHTEDLPNLRRILQNERWELMLCRSVAEATQRLSQSAASIVLCERNLSDGDWKDILQETDKLPNAPLVLVISRHADDNLWAEVLNLGGYDVLLKPFDRGEVTRVLGMAWRCWFGGMLTASGPGRLTPQFV